MTTTGSAGQAGGGSDSKQGLLPQTQVGILTPSPWDFGQVTSPMCASVYSSVKWGECYEAKPHGLELPHEDEWQFRGTFSQCHREVLTHLEECQARGERSASAASGDDPYLSLSGPREGEPSQGVFFLGAFWAHGVSGGERIHLTQTCSSLAPPACSPAPTRGPVCWSSLDKGT